jgi:hypothetical protein
MPVLLDILVEEVGALYREPRVVWSNYKPDQNDMKQLEQNSLANNTFDRAALKNRVWNEYKKGAYVCIGKECEYGRVVALLSPGTKIPLDDWGLIFKWFGKPAGGGKWLVYWFGSQVKREFPKKGLPMGPEHVNGGYTTRCSTEGIFIYRLEEATRVLVHELVHAACLDPDPATTPVPVLEANTETWAELLLIAFRSGGNFEKAASLWNAQKAWIQKTNQRALSAHSVRNQNDYAWRYLNGRVEVYARLGFDLGRGAAVDAARNSGKSSRFTAPELDATNT